MPQVAVETALEKQTTALETLVVGIAAVLVEDQQSLAVASNHDEQGTTIVLQVARMDLGKIVGKQGRTARSLRVVLQAASIKLGRKLTLDIQGIDPPLSQL